MSAVEFVQLVEMYPCIYNSDLPDYARKDTTEKAWQEVASELDWPGKLPYLIYYHNEVGLVWYFCM